MNMPSTELKSAEEWAEAQTLLISDMFGIPQDKRETLTRHLVIHNSSIQLNAVKHGMTLAARISIEHLYSLGRKYEGKESREAILTARDNKTTLP